MAEIELTQKPTPVNILPVLSNLEEYLTTLIAWNSYITDSGLSILPLDKMSYKRFNLTPVSVKSTLADTVWSDEEHEDGRVPMREEQIRDKVRRLVASRTDLTPKAVLADHKKSYRSPF